MTPEQIVDAALAEGVGRFTMPAVARRIGLSHSGIYRSFADREALVDACLARIAEQIVWREPAADWPTFLHEYADTLWDTFTAHPGSAEALLQATAFPAAVVDWQRRAFAHLGRLGLDPGTAHAALDLVGDLVWIGVVGAERMADRVPAGGTRGEQFEQSLSLDPEQPAPLWHGRAFLHRKIDLLVTGVRPAPSP